MEQDKSVRVMSLLDSFLGEQRDDTLDYEKGRSAVVDYVNTYLESESTTPVTPAGSEIRSTTEQLLDTFLSAHKNSGGASFLHERNDGMGAVTSNVDDDNSDVQVLDDKYYTQTLAQIYLKQQRYDKALQIIRSLYLNFPNKSIYFADQIRYLEKLVRINQIIK